MAFRLKAPEFPRSPNSESGLTAIETTYYKKSAPPGGAIKSAKGEIDMVAANLKRAGNELDAKTTYQLFLEKEGVPAARGFHIEDINAVDLHPWTRPGGRGVY